MMMLYPTLDILRQFYCAYTKKEIAKYNSIVIIASYYETTESVRWNLSLSPYSLNVAKYEDDGSLIISDATNLYSTNDRALEFVTNIANEAKSLGKKAVTMMADMGAFHEREHPDDIIDYEISFLPKRFNIDRKGFCLYNIKDMELLSPEQTQGLSEQHCMIIELMSNWDYIKFEFWG